MSMTRLFDAGKEERQAEDARRHRAEVKERVKQAEILARELEAEDKATEKLRETLSQQQAVHPVRYSEYRKRGSKWMIEHARAGDDYVYQLFPLKPPAIAWQDVALLVIAALDVIFPEDVHKVIKPPSQEFKVQYYTITIKDVCKLPGWEGACVDRALPALAEVNGWQAVSQAGE